jgi:hypothetical protein
MRMVRSALAMLAAAALAIGVPAAPALAQKAKNTPTLPEGYRPGEEPPAKVDEKKYKSAVESMGNREKKAPKADPWADMRDKK